VRGNGLGQNAFRCFGWNVADFGRLVSEMYGLTVTDGSDRAFVMGGWLLAFTAM
jgi:hypothetical protein